MKSSRVALGLVGLALAGLWYFAGGTQPLPVSRAADSGSRVEEPRTHENLSVYFIRGDDSVRDAKVLSLQEALERNLAVVHETSSVNTLAVENRSPDHELFIQSGDIVKGGKQDRMAQSDMLLPPNSGVVPLPAHCVEQGRWTKRGSEDASGFKSSVRCAVGNQMKLANYGGQQGQVWQTVADNQGKLTAKLSAKVNADASPTSFQLTLDAPALQAQVAQFEAALKAAGEAPSDIIGVVFVVNGQVTGAEVYGSNVLFRKAWPKLLNSAAVEAVAERTDRAPVAPPVPREIERYLARAADPEPEEDRVAATDNFTPERMTQQLSGRGLDFSVYSPRTSGRLADPARASTSEAIPAGAQTDRQQAGLPDPAGRLVIEGNTVTQNRVILNQVRGGLRAGNYGNPLGNATAVSGERAPQSQEQGNRLQSNRAENGGNLVVESRDPNRQNAVIHKSYVKK